MGKYAEDAKQLLRLVGGKENIAAVSHCMTRMRFALVEPSRADVKAIEAMKVVKGSFTQSGQILEKNQWRLEPENPSSTILDSISISPQECFTLDILYGAGSFNHVIGDAILHCHLYPHFIDGMWTLWRIYDRLQDRTGKLPDGTPIAALQPLKDREKPLKKDELHPGYPNFIEGVFGEPPLQPPLGVRDADGNVTNEPTLLEQANFVENAVPEALYTDTCPCNKDENVKIFEIALEVLHGMWSQVCGEFSG